MRDFERTVTSDSSRRVGAFTATPNGIFTPCDSERGVRLTLAGQPDRRLYAEVGHVDAIVAVRGDALWLIAYPTRAGGLLAGVSAIGEPGQPAESMAIAHVSTNGSVRQIVRWPGDAWQRNVGSIAAGRNGDVWLSEPYANRIVRVDSAGTRREYREQIPNGAVPTGIAVDRDGSVWFSDGARSSIGHLWPDDGHVQMFGNGLAPNGSPIEAIAARRPSARSPSLGTGRSGLRNRMRIGSSGSAPTGHHVSIAT